MTEKKLSLDLADVVFKDDVLRVYYKNVNIELQQIKDFVAAIKVEFAAEIPFLMVVDISKQSSPKKEVREYMGSSDVSVLTKAGAMVASSILTRVIGNLYLALTKPSVPNKIFSDEASAVKWLQQFRN